MKIEVVFINQWLYQVLSESWRALKRQFVKSFSPMNLNDNLHSSIKSFHLSAAETSEHK